MSDLNRIRRLDRNGMSKANKVACEGNIDPARMDIDDKRGRRRKSVHRKREPLPEIMKPWVDAAYHRKEGRSCPPGVMIEIDGWGPEATFRLVSPHENDEAWENMMADAFGTRSWSVIKTFLDQLRELAPGSFDHTNQVWKPSERSLNAGLAIIHASRPENELDAMLCAQAVAVHWMQMRASASVLSSHSSYVNDRTAATCSRLSRAFCEIVEAINRRKRKPKLVRQEITVRRDTHYHTHKHVHVVEEGAVQIGDQPHATTTKIIGAPVSEECSALPSPEPLRPNLRFASGEGQGRLPHARCTRRSPQG
jgi:hypothetical protein